MGIAREFQMTDDRRILVPARHGKAVWLRVSQAVRVINTYGTQVVDCWAWNAYDLNEHMSMEASRVWTQRLNPRVGDTFVTVLRQPILTVVEDTSPGVHDTFMAACCRHRYTLLGVHGYHRNCRDNMFEAMQALGVTVPAPILASFNIFMNIAVQPDGISLNTLPTVTKAGDYITLRAEMDCYVAFSACPQDIVTIQGGGENTPRDVELEILDGGFPNPKIQGAWVPIA
jgi:uncharacterized protein YcgI (DUF1989 family)